MWKTSMYGGCVHQCVNPQLMEFLSRLSFFKPNVCHWYYHWYWSAHTLPHTHSHILLNQCPQLASNMGVCVCVGGGGVWNTPVCVWHRGDWYDTYHLSHMTCCTIHVSRGDTTGGGVAHPFFFSFSFFFSFFFFLFFFFFFACQLRGQSCTLMLINL